MNKKEKTLKAIMAQAVLPLYFHPDAAVSADIMRSLYSAGIRVIEYTNRGETALANFSKLKKICEKEYSDMILGLGTITDGETADKAIHAGVDFLVSPGLVKEVDAVANKHKLLWIPGCMTPTEMIKARQWGISFVKLFPGNLLGPSFVQSVKELFPGLLFMPTGGVEPNQENLQNWFNAGVSAVGMGSKLITASILENRDYETLTLKTKELLELISSFKK